MERGVSTRRFNACLFTVFALLALVLAATGVYGVISYSVAGRMQGMTLVLAGLIIGLTGAFALTRLMSTLLYGVSTTDRATFTIVAWVAVGWFVGVLLAGAACH